MMMPYSEESDPEYATGETDPEASALFTVGSPLLALIIATGALSLAKDVLVPLTAALILGVVLSPISGRLERSIGRGFSAGLLVLAGVAIIVSVAYVTIVELAAVADEVAGYSDNIASKLAAIEKSTPPWLRHTETALSSVTERVEKSSSNLPRTAHAETVTISSSFLRDDLPNLMPALAAVVKIPLVIVLLFFILYSRRDLRDRFVRLAASARVRLASQAIESAGHAVGRYLLLLSVINLGFGIVVGLVLWTLGLPNPEFWGMLAFLLRYVPYVGALMSSLLPALVAFAVFPGWSRSLEVVSALIVLDQIGAHLAEPFIIGPGIDISPVALLVSTIYWSWLWGIPGLLLAIPLTSCLKVAGEHIPALNFLALLLGGERILESYHDFYRLLLELDSDGARALAVRYGDEHGLEQTFDELVTPVLRLAGKERAEGHISEDHQKFILETTREIVSALGNRFCEPRTGTRSKTLGACSPGELHSLGLLMILELFRCAGASVKFLGENRSIEQACETARIFSPEVVCLSCTLTEYLPAAAELTAALKAELPYLTIIAGGVAAVSYPADLLRAGWSQVCATRSQRRNAIRQLTIRKAPRDPSGRKRLVTERT
jgi:predicted PurR-regulated permease PerM/methanogenic corrinoid protein MtbC1